MGDFEEYEGARYLESELITAAPDKLQFLVKDMIA